MFTMFTGASCPLPRQSYDPATLPAEYHGGVLDFFRRSAERDILPTARTRAELPGLRERCEEVAAAAYLHWREGRFPKVAAGDHAHALYATRRYFRLTGWQGMNGLRRQSYRKRTREMMAERERSAQRTPMTPPAMAIAVERLTASPTLYRKALILAGKAGYGSVDAMLAAVAGEGHTRRGAFTPTPTPTAGIPATAGDGTECRGTDAGWMDASTDAEKIGRVRHWIRVQ